MAHDLLPLPTSEQEEEDEEVSRAPTQSDKARRRNDGLSRQMKRRVERNRCPTCGRGDAVKTIRFPEVTIRECRWKCGYSRGLTRPTDGGA